MQGIEDTSGLASPVCIDRVAGCPAPCPPKVCARQIPLLRSCVSCTENQARFLALQGLYRHEGEQRRRLATELRSVIRALWVSSSISAVLLLGIGGWLLCR